MRFLTRGHRMHQPLAFLVIGLTSAAIDYGVFLALHGMGMPPPAASAASFLSAFAVNYGGNRDFVFEASRAPGALSRYAVLVLLNLGLSSGGVWLRCVDPAGPDCGQTPVASKGSFEGDTHA